MPQFFALVISLLRAGVAAALLAVAPLVVPQAAGAAEKAFQNSELAESAIELEAQIKSDAGTPTKPLPQIRRDADAAFTKNDFRAGMAVLGQIVAAAPNDSATWLRLARTIMQIRPADDNEKQLLLERASTAAYIAYQRTTSRARKPTAWLCSATCWASASSGGRRSMRSGSRSNCAKPPTCAGNMSGCARRTASACSITASMPTRRRRAPASSSPKICRRAPISRRSWCSPAPTSRRLSAAEKQLCVEGLQHGQTIHRHPARRPAVDRA